MYIKTTVLRRSPQPRSLCVPVSLLCFVVLASRARLSLVLSVREARGARVREAQGLYSFSLAPNSLHGRPARARSETSTDWPVILVESSVWRKEEDEGKTHYFQLFFFFLRLLLLFSSHRGLKKKNTPRKRAGTRGCPRAHASKLRRAGKARASFSPRSLRQVLLMRKTLSPQVWCLLFSWFSSQ